VFPESYFVLIEPLKIFEHSLVSILKRYRGTYVLAAAGSRLGEVRFNVHENHLDGSSLYKESMGPEADGYEIAVPMIRLDDILEDRNLCGPYLIKIDVQGAELDVLDGAQRSLPKAEVIVLEVSMFEFLEGAPQFYDVVSYMKRHGFVAYDIVLGWNRPLDGALGQVDFAFVKEDGVFRRDHAYSSVPQMKELFRQPAER
jgi:FkbM family methyltransferase